MLPSMKLRSPLLRVATRHNNVMIDVTTTDADAADTTVDADVGNFSSVAVVALSLAVF